MTFKTKIEALRKARELRAAGKTVKVYSHFGIFTAPGEGVRSYLHYTVVVEA